MSSISRSNGSGLSEDRRHPARRPGRLAALATAVVVALAAAALASSPAAAQELVLSGDTTLWSGWLTTVDYYDANNNILTGCSDEGRGREVGHSRCSTWLTRSTFDLAGETYRIITLAADSSGNVILKVDKDIHVDHLDYLVLETLPWVSPVDTLTSHHQGFSPGFTQPDSTDMVAVSATSSLFADGSVSFAWAAGVTDWRMATSTTINYPNGRSCPECSGTAWGGVALRIVYEGTAPQAPQAPAGSGQTNTQGLGRLPEPVIIPDPGGQPPQEQKHGEAPEPTRPPLEGVAGDYDADGDGLISSDEYLTGATDYGRTDLTTEEILQLRQAYIDSQK
jgi:hypothetical protein